MITPRQPKWTYRFIRLAAEVASWSKDPSSKVGAVIVRPDRTIASVGFNGFPRGILDREDWLADRDKRLALTIHAEENAILSAREPLQGYSIFVHPYPPCLSCAMRIVQAGITTVISPAMAIDHRWFASCHEARKQMEQVGLRVRWLPKVAVDDAVKGPIT